MTTSALNTTTRSGRVVVAWRLILPCASFAAVVRHESIGFRSTCRGLTF
jgi:hypothetical protein